MASCISFFNQPQHLTGWRQAKQPNLHSFLTDRLKRIIRRHPTEVGKAIQSRRCCLVRVTASLDVEPSPLEGGGLLVGKASNSFEVARNINPDDNIPGPTQGTTSHFIQRLMMADIDPATAKLAIGFLGSFLSAFGFLFILRIVMSWYPKLPVGKFPYVIAYAPTEPLLIPTRKLIPPLGGVDVTPVVWFGLVSFLNEILVGPQGLLVLLSQQVN